MRPNLQMTKACEQSYNTGCTENSCINGYTIVLWGVTAEKKIQLMYNTLHLPSYFEWDCKNALTPLPLHSLIRCAIPTQLPFCCTVYYSKMLYKRPDGSLLRRGGRLPALNTVCLYWRPWLLFWGGEEGRWVLFQHWMFECTKYFSML